MSILCSFAGPYMFCSTLNHVNEYYIFHRNLFCFMSYENHEPWPQLPHWIAQTQLILYHDNRTLHHCDNSLFRRILHIDGLMHERRNSIAKTLELRLSCINPSIFASKRRSDTWAFLGSRVEVLYYTSTNLQHMFLFRSHVVDRRWGQKVSHYDVTWQRCVYIFM